ncbi:unnamed protein product, partial [Choristocarpus tenellus]
RGLERRLKSRVPKARGRGVPEGRTIPKRSEEDFWFAAGVYDTSRAPGTDSLKETGGAGTIADRRLGVSSARVHREAKFARLVSFTVAPAQLQQVVNFYKKEVAPVLQVRSNLPASIPAMYTIWLFISMLTNTHRHTLSLGYDCLCCFLKVPN